MNIAIDSSALHYERQRGIGNYIYSHYRKNIKSVIITRLND